MVALVFLGCANPLVPGPDGENPETETVETPVFDPVEGAYNADQLVSISCATSGVTIYYTTDNSEPTTSSAVYSAPISVAGDGTAVTIKACATKNEMADSTVASGTYSIDYTQVATPTFSPTEGTFTTAQSVTISCTTPGASIRYTPNGSEPTSSTGTLYTGAVDVSSTTTLKAIAYLAGWADSSVSTALYTITGTVATPTFSPTEGTYTTAQSVTISCTTPGASIRYTTDGSEPTSSTGTQYSGVIYVLTTTTLKAMAYCDGWIDSSTQTATYTIVTKLPRTGQTSSYGTGDDGNLQKGAVWPSPRFVDNGNGTVTDKLTGLMWERTPSTSNRTWANALTYCSGLSLGGNSDWRLPNRDELKSLLNAGQANQSTWLNTQSFSGVSDSAYWSSTTVAKNSATAWIIAIDSGGGGTSSADKTTTWKTWAVRTYNSGTVVLPATGQSTSYATGDDGDLGFGAAWPSPRFTDNGDGTITDNLTGLMWEKSPSSTAQTWSNGLTYCNNLSLAGYTDWRYPNRHELMSLMNMGETNQRVWLYNQGFEVWSTSNYWTSSTYAPNTANAWVVDTTVGGSVALLKTGTWRVWAVRAGW
jgi:hypothetical protein